VNGTDAYFERTAETLDHAGVNPEVVAEVTADQFGNGTDEVFAGLDEVLELLDGVPVTVEALPEGAAFDGGPVMRLSGNYRDFCKYETELLGYLSHASGFATGAAAVSRASADTPVFSFGSRHIHPSLAETMERAAWIGGVDGFSNTAAESVLPAEASGTMPHALMLAFGKERKTDAWTAFNEAVADDVPRTVLADTFTDEVDETLEAAEVLGDDLDAVRLDTTGSRRGDFKHIIREVRYKLDEAGREDVDIFVSGGLDWEDCGDLNDYVDGFGVGSAISNADPVDFSLDIVEREGEPISKRGKLSGVKDVDMETYIDNGSVVKETDVQRARELLAQQRQAFFW